MFQGSATGGSGGITPVKIINYEEKWLELGKVEFRSQWMWKGEKQTEITDPAAKIEENNKGQTRTVD